MDFFMKRDPEIITIDDDMGEKNFANVKRFDKPKSRMKPKLDSMGRVKIAFRHRHTDDTVVAEELEAMAPLGQFELSTRPSRKPAISLLSDENPFASKQEKSKTRVEAGDKLEEINLRKSLDTVAITKEEKWRVLESRDKLYQIIRAKENAKNDKLVGTCPDMCPEKERLARIFQLQVSPFEMTDCTKNTEAREDWMVKQYTRSAADQEKPLPHDLRPINVLQRTMSHLCRYIVDHCEFSDDLLQDWYMFLWDRTRALRKDLTQQGISSLEAAYLLEKCARFHIHCAERLIDQDTSIYDDRINTENLTKCLRSLKYIYDELAVDNIHSENEPEFVCYSLLLNLNNPKALTEVLAVHDADERILNSKPVLFALNVFSAWETKNYIRFFRLVKEATYLNSCLLRRYFNEMRLNAIKAMVHAYCPNRKYRAQIHVNPIINNLMFEGVQDCILHHNSCNLQVDKEDSDYVLTLDRNSFTNSSENFPVLRSFLWIDAKKSCLLSEIISAGPVDYSEVTAYEVHSSFTNDGVLKPDSILNKEEVAHDVRRVEKDMRNNFSEFEGNDEDNMIDDDNSNSCFKVPTGNIFSPNAPLLKSFETKALPVGKPQGFSINKDNAGISNVQVFETAHNIPSIFGGYSSSTVNYFNKPLTTTSSMSFSKLMEKLQQQKDQQQQHLQQLQQQQQLPISAPTLNVVEQKTNKPVTFKAKENETKEEDLEKLRQQLLEQKKQKEENDRIRLQKLRLDEERRIKEIKEKKEAEERKIREEQKRKKDAEKAKKLLEKLMLQKEKEEQIRNKRLAEFRVKFQRWKIKNCFDKWRKRVWFQKEARKVDKYMADLKHKYPPVCQRDILGDDTLTEYLPNILHTRKYRPSKHIVDMTRTSLSVSEQMQMALPLVNIGDIVGDALQKRVNHFYPSPLSPFHYVFPWKLVLALPDELETSNVNVADFIERHFVDHLDWKLGVQSGPLTYCVHRIGSLTLHLSVRRIKGPELYEGSEKNLKCLHGANSLIFFMTDDLNGLHRCMLRFERVRSAPNGLSVPLVVFVFGVRLSEEKIRDALNLSKEHRVVMCKADNEQSLVTTISSTLVMAGEITSDVPKLRTVTIESFFKTNILEKIWDRVEGILQIFKLSLMDPAPVIGFYNKSIDDLATVLLKEKRENASFIAEEFFNLMETIESPLKFGSAPTKNRTYTLALQKILNSLKLPSWGSDRITNTQKLNFRLHLYCVKIAMKDKAELKKLKWKIYNAVQKLLPWKGLDIYCDDDVNVIMANFPWIQIFRELSNIIVEKYFNSETEDFFVTFDKEDVEEFINNSYLIDRLDTCSISSETSGDVPHPEEESVLLSFAEAIQNDESRMKRKYTEDIWDVLNQSKKILLDDKNHSNIEKVAEFKKSCAAVESTLVDIEERLAERRTVLNELTRSFK